MTFPLDFPLYDDDTRIYIDGNMNDFQLICDGVDLSDEFANLRTKDDVSYVLDHSPRYNPTLLKTVEVLDYDKKGDGTLPSTDDDRKEHKALTHVLNQLEKEAQEAKAAAAQVS